MSSEKINCPKCRNTVMVELTGDQKILLFFRLRPLLCPRCGHDISDKSGVGFVSTFLTNPLGIFLFLTFLSILTVITVAVTGLLP